VGFFMILKISSNMVCDTDDSVSSFFRF